MALVTFKDLCIDAVDPMVMGRFWAPALGLTLEPHDDGDARLVGAEPAQTVWINKVPEAKTVKQRVHLDVNGQSLAEYESFGARVLPGWGPFSWTVMADPEGGEFCLFESDRPPAARHDEIPPRWADAYRLYEVCVDTANSSATAAWWAELFGVRAQGSDREFYWIEGMVGCPFDSIVFLEVPEPKTVKNRIHWDVTLTAGVSVDDLIAVGARLLRGPTGQDDWTVMADPDGNEFCVFVPS